MPASTHSDRVRGSDLRAVFRLVHEACELGDDAMAWRFHVLDGLDPLIGMTMGLIFVGRLPCDPANMTMPVFAGKQIDPHWTQYASSGDVRPDPCTTWIVPRLSRGFSGIRQIMCTERTWYGSDYFNLILRPSRLDHYLMSVIALPEKGVYSTIGLTGGLRDRPFNGRDVKLLQILHEELARLWQSPSLHQPPEWRKALSPRLTQVLDGLLRGLSEKQIALELSLRRATVHNHISRLHRLLEVSSLGELLAKARPPAEFRPRLLPA